MGVNTVRDNHELVLISQEGTVIRVAVKDIRTTGRNTMGVRVMNLRGADRVSSMARLVRTADGNGVKSTDRMGYDAGDGDDLNTDDPDYIDDLESLEESEEGAEGGDEE